MIESQEKQKELARKRQQAHRQKQKALGVTELRLKLYPIDIKRLDAIRTFFSYPEGVEQNYDNTQDTIEALIHRVYDELPQIREKLGTCSHCGHQLPEGCCKDAPGGLFHGSAKCWHTLHRVRIHDITRPTDEAYRK